MIIELRLQRNYVLQIIEFITSAVETKVKPEFLKGGGGNTLQMIVRE